MIFVLQLLLLSVAVVSCSRKHVSDRMQIDLSGYWTFKLDSTALFSDSLYLPGTTDLAKKGVLNTKMDETEHLSRIYTFEGKAWYQKKVTVPDSWKGKYITLYMERTKPSRIYVDGIPAGSSTDISTPQVYQLSRQLTPGEHILTVVVDNGKCLPARIVTKSHMYTDATQTNWNGIIGRFYLEAKDRCHIQDVNVYPDIHSKTAKVRVRLQGAGLVSEPIAVSCSGESWNTDEVHKIRTVKTEIQPGASECTFTLALGDDMLLWSEFHPSLYRIRVNMESGSFKDSEEASFGMREFKTREKQFIINDKVTFLRGKHDACVFPLTGHVAMDVKTWRHYFQVAKQYGINHYRFHSWCPPEACFEAADIEGIYLQPETPYWGTIRAVDTLLISFMTKEGVNMRETYSNHPSYMMYAIGNELSGPDSVRKQILDVVREGETRHLHAYGSNTGCGYCPVQDDEDYYNTCRIAGSFTSFERHTRASFNYAGALESGRMNHDYPNTEGNFEHAVSLCRTPIISFEIGQYQVYPNFDEMEKYTGVLEPRNFAVFKKRLQDAGLGDLAKDYVMASGKWSAELYCAEMEMDLRTRNFGGFQLLDLQDYPGQGSSYVGMLDAFMDSKGLITPEEWRQSCCEVVPMFEAPAYTHYADENLRGRLTIANYSENDLGGNLKWTLKSASGNVLSEGVCKVAVKQGDVGEVGKLDVDISSIRKAEKCTLFLCLEGTPYKNDYPVWVYPAEIDTTPSQDVYVTGNWDSKLLSVLENGGKAVWFPSRKFSQNVTVGGLFITDFWNYKMFLRASIREKRDFSPGTLGLLMDPKHPLFENFPTEFHSNWQWFPIVKESYPMILDTLPNSYRPLIQVIDNMERNHKLGLVYEFSVEGGKLLVCMADLDSKYRDKPEVRQFKSALLQYAGSDLFNPKFKISAGDLQALFRH